MIDEQIEVANILCFSNVHVVYMYRYMYVSKSQEAQTMSGFHTVSLLYKQYFTSKQKPTGLNGHPSLNCTCLICQSMHLIMTIKKIYDLWVGISATFKIIYKLYNEWGGDDLICTYLICFSMHSIVNFKNIYGLWVGISTIFKILSKLYNEGAGVDPWGTYLICSSMHLIMTNKNIYGLWVGISTIFMIIFQIIL